MVLEVLLSYTVVFGLLFPVAVVAASYGITLALKRFFGDEYRERPRSEHR